MYSIKETYRTLQGEGFQVGRVAVFCRFAGCNLWNGKDGDRASAACPFCDTDFIGTNGPGGGKFASADDLADHVESTWGDALPDRLVVFTGGEPLLQLDECLLTAMRERGFQTAVETNGTILPPPGIDWLTVSPKGISRLRTSTGQELKLVFPQRTALPSQFESMKFDHFFLQPLDGPDLIEHTRAAVEYCLANPKWRLSVQMHKLVGIR